MNTTILIGKSCAPIFACAFLLSLCNGATPLGENILKQDKKVVINNITDPSLPGKLSVLVRDGLDVNS